jgi:hypothetical protein
MKKKLGWVVGALVIALLAVGAYGTTTALADDTTPSATFGRHGPGGLGGHPGGHPLTDAELEAAAAVLNMSADDLSAALESGKTLDYLAGEAGVDLQEVHDALQAVRAEAMRERITQALADGDITQEHADWLLEGLDKGYLDGPGFGFGGHPGKGIPPAASTPTE